MGVCVTSLASTARAEATPKVAALWAGPTRLLLPFVRYGDFVGTVDAQRTGVGAGSAAVCLHFWKETDQPDGTRRIDSLGGCQVNAMQSAYSFDPLRWKGELSVSVPVERWWVLEHSDGTLTSHEPASRGLARLGLRWTGFGHAKVTPSVGMSLALIPVYAGVTATKHAEISGTISLGNDVVRVTRAAGQMQHGSAA